MLAITGRLAPAVFLLAMAAPCLAQSSLTWETNFEAAQKKAAEQNKLLLIHFGAEWCAPCQRLENQVFNQPGFGQGLDARFVCVKLDFDQHSELAGRMGVQRIPTDVILTPQGQMLQQAASPMSGEAYVAGMMRVADYVVQATAATATPSAAAAPTTVAAIATAATSSAASAPPADQAALVGDRYASYAQPPVAPATPAAPAAAAPAVETQAPPIDITALASPAAPTATAPSAPPLPQQATAQQPAASPAAAASAELATQSPVKAQFAGLLPEGSPPLALDGFSAVTLVEQKKWTLGDARWGAIHHGRTYLFCAEDEQKRFLASPDRYSPVLAGSDPVLALDEGRTVDGDRRYGLFYENRVYLFHDEASLERFSQHPNRYAGDMLQVLRR